MCSASNSGSAAGAALTALPLRHRRQDRPPKLLDPGAVHRGDGEHVERRAAQPIAPFGDQLVCPLPGHQVPLREHDQLGPKLQPGAVGAQLLPHRLVRRDGVLARDVDQMDQHAAALHVSEELVSQPRALRGALDQAGDVGEDQLAVVELERPEHGLDGRERIGGDLRRGPRHPSQKRRLACVRLTHQAGVGQQLEPQLDPAGLALQPPLGKAWRLTGRAGEALVAVAPQAPGRDHGALSGLDEVVLTQLEAVHLGSRWHQDRLVARHAPRAAACLSRDRHARRGSAARGEARPGRAWRGRRPGPRLHPGHRRPRRARLGARAPRGGS